MGEHLYFSNAPVVCAAGRIDDFFPHRWFVRMTSAVVIVTSAGGHGRTSHLEIHRMCRERNHPNHEEHKNAARQYCRDLT